MDLNALSTTLQQNAVGAVFVNVLLQQAGLPVPAVPTLLLAGSLVAGPGPLAAILAAAVVASVIADWAWYLAGRVFGYRVLAGLCKLSINPASCVSQTEARFVRWGVSSLVVAKFIPGFSTVAPPIAGSLRMGLGSFLFSAAVGAALWAGLALGAGWLLRDEVQAAIAFLDRNAGSAGMFLALGVAIWLGWKLWQKYRFRRLAAVAFILPDELRSARAAGSSLLLLDLRGPSMVAETGRLAGATLAEHDHLLDAVGDWPKDQPIVTLCACPEDAGAVQAARRLLDAGYLSVRPLKGGYEAWVALVGGVR